MNLEFLMTDILPLLPIEQPPAGRDQYNLFCPECDSCYGSSKHLNINIRKNVFNCPRCNFHGGVLALYGYFNDLSYREAADSLRRLRGDEQPHEKKRKNKNQTLEPKTEDPTLASIEDRNKVYSCLLSMLRLNNKHLANLNDRGLDMQTIYHNGYATYPQSKHQAIAEKLIDKGLELINIPGFYFEDGKWLLAEMRPGILHPIRDQAGRIQCLKIRLDNATKNKFRFMSSSHKATGAKPFPYVHFTVPLSGQKDVLITEGAIKSDVVYKLSGIPTMGVDSVTSFELLPETLRALPSDVKIWTAFDMDMFSNPHVLKGYIKFLKTINRNCKCKFGTLIWDERYKGLDDYLHGNPDINLRNEIIRLSQSGTIKQSIGGSI